MQALYIPKNVPYLFSVLMSEQPYDNGATAPELLNQNDKYPHEDGLEEEIQRAIAQHDLAQQLHRGGTNSPERNEDEKVDVKEEYENTEHSVTNKMEVVKEVHEDGRIDDNINENIGESIDENIDRDISHRIDNNNAHSGHNDNNIGHNNDPNLSNNISENISNNISNIIHGGMDMDEEKSQLLMIANELERASEPQLNHGNSEKSSSPGDNQTNQNDSDSSHPGYIPADSELLATNTALAAYNALSSQAPPVALLTNAHLAAVPLPIVAPDYFPARIQLLINTLPVLDNLLTQLLRVFASGPYQKIIDVASTPETPSGAAFRDLTSLFEFTKRLYSEEDPFLTVEHLAPGMWKEGEKTPSMFRSREQTIESTLRKVNLATFLAATLGTIEVGFFYLNESFLDVFCPANNLDPANTMSTMSSTNMNLQSGANTVVGDKVGKLLKSQALIFIDLKTQAYISAVEAGERSREDILEDILPTNLEQILLDRRGVKVLSPTEADFVSRCQSRKETLLNYPDGSNLSEEYEWFSFLQELFDYVAKNMGFLIWGKKARTGQKSDRPPAPTTYTPTTYTPTTYTPHSEETLASVTENTEVTTRQEINDITSALLPSEIQEQQIHIRINPGMQGKVTNRRPWTREEEKALRHALELKGTQWSTILELFGQGGRINELLKNRTQVQLKDKARNWKMFFLKLGLPVPAYLQKVTGDLERDDKVRAKNARIKKTAAAPVPAVNKKDEDGDRKRQRVG